MIAKLSIRKWVWNFLWEYRIGLFSHSADSVPANTSPFHLSAFVFLLEIGIPGSGRDQHCFKCRTCTSAMTSSHFHLHALKCCCFPSHLGNGWMCCRVSWHLRTSPFPRGSSLVLSPSPAPSQYVFFFFFVLDYFLSPWAYMAYHLSLHSQIVKC